MHTHIKRLCNYRTTWVLYGVVYGRFPEILSSRQPEEDGGVGSGSSGGPGGSPSVLPNENARNSRRETSWRDSAAHPRRIGERFNG